MRRKLQLGTVQLSGIRATFRLSKSQSDGERFPKMSCAAFSATAYVAATVLPDTIRGITDASTTRKPDVP